MTALQHGRTFHSLAGYFYGARCRRVVLFAERFQDIVTVGGPPEPVDGFGASGQQIKATGAHESGQITQATHRVEHINGGDTDDMGGLQCLGAGGQSSPADSDQFSCRGDARREKTEYIHSEIKHRLAVVALLKIDNGGSEGDQVQQKLTQRFGPVIFVHGGLPACELFDCGVIQIQMLHKGVGNRTGPRAAETAHQ
ncbi:hypothetical protein D3C81_887380 [compost metagenome]